MATDVIPQPPIHYFNRDTRSSSSNYSLYTSDAHHRIASGDFIFQSNDNSKKPKKKKSLSKLTESELEEQPLSNAKSATYRNIKKGNPKKEFTVVRKNSYKSPAYFRLSQKSSLSRTHRRSSRFANSKQIDPVFDMFPETSLLENPSYMVQYFTKTLNLIKKEPDIHYKILKAHIDTNNNDQREGLVQRTKKEKYKSLPIMGSSKTLQQELNEARNNKRNSAPVILTYQPTNLTMVEYLNTPLDFYKHRKQSSVATTTDDSKETKLSSKAQTTSSGTQFGSENKAGSSGSGGESVSTSALYARRSKLIDNTDRRSAQRSYPLKTEKKNSVLKSRSILPTDSASDNVNYHLKKELLPLKREELFSRYGTLLLENSAGRTIVEEENPKIKRRSDCGDLSIATGNEIYNQVRNDIFAKRFSDWDTAYQYISKIDPDLAENHFFLNRFMLELYIRRVLSAKIALKLGTDKSNKGEGGEVWIGLRECIASVYGEDNAMFFESQNAHRK